MRFLAYTGLRFGELAALGVGQLNLDTRRARIVEAVAEVRGRGPSPAAEPPTTSCSARRSDLTPHALRHTAASLAIAAGANVKVVQTMLGHKSATMTLDPYGHLFVDQLDEVSDAMERSRTRSLGIDL